MKNKKIFLTLFAAFVCIINVFTSTVTVREAKADSNYINWIVCQSEMGKSIYNGGKTDVIPFALRSKSSIIQGESDTVKDNMFNNIMEAGGYTFGQEDRSAFSYFGFAGLNLSSYGGEWKYTAVDACANLNNSTGASSSDYGAFYSTRYEPQSAYQEVATSSDIRTQQFNNGLMHNVGMAIRDGILSFFLNVVKFIVAFTITMIGLSYTDISSFIGIDFEAQKTIFTGLYTGIFQPFVFLMIFMTAIFVFYQGIVKRQFRTALQGLGKTIIIFIIAGVLAAKPQFLSIPGNLANVGQAIIVSTLGTAEAPANSICGIGADKVGASSSQSIVSNVDGEKAQDFLTEIAESSKDAIGCRLWAELVFRPWTHTQWGENYEDLVELGNENEEWVGKPIVKVGENEVENWALFQVSTQTDKHTPFDGTPRPHINGVDADWYRIVDALSNVTYEEIELPVSTFGNWESGDGSGGVNGMTNFGVGNVAMQAELKDTIWNHFRGLGFSEAATAAIMGNIEQESSFNPTAVNSSGATGLAQWLGTRRDGLMDYARKEGRSWRDPAVQIGFMTWELMSDNYERRNLNTEAFMQLQDVNQAAEIFAIKFERPGAHEINLPARKSYSAQYYQQYTGRPVTATDLSSLSSGGGKLVEVVTPVVPTPQWNYWIGNEGGRTTSAVMAILVALVASIPLLFFSLLNGIYSIGINLLMMFSPIFLLTGLWAGRGHRILLSWLTAVFSTIIKKILTGFLLIVSIIVTTNITAKISEFGYIKTTIILGVVGLILIKNKETIIEKFSQVNLPGADGTDITKAFRDSSQKVKNVSRQAATYTAGTALVGTLGAAKAARSGGSAAQGAKVSAAKYLQNKAYSSKNADLRQTAVRYSDDEMRKKYSGSAKETFCSLCNRKVEKNESVYRDDIGNKICKECGDLNYLYEESYADAGAFCDFCGNEVTDYDLTEFHEKKICPSCKERYGTEEDPHIVPSDSKLVNEYNERGFREYNKNRQEQVYDDSLKDKKELKRREKQANKEERRLARKSKKEKAKDKKKPPEPVNMGKLMLDNANKNKALQQQLKDKRKEKIAQEKNTSKEARNMNKELKKRR